MRRVMAVPLIVVGLCAATLLTPAAASPSPVGAAGLVHVARAEAHAPPSPPGK